MSSLSANLRIRVKPNICVHIKRKLTGKGSLSVSKNQEVQPQDILGRSEVVGGFSVINIAKQLNIHPTEGKKYLKVIPGKAIFKGELLALKPGMFKKQVIIAPNDSIVESYNEQTGDLHLKFQPKEASLTAGVYGIIDEVNPTTQEVLIKSIATEIFGIYGIGGERSGFLNLIHTQSGMISASEINSSHKNQILVTGNLVFGESLKKAMSVGVQGLISGGLNLTDYLSFVGSIYWQKRRFSDVGISIISTEGFGPIPIGDDISQLLTQHQGRFVFLNGFTNRLLLPSVTPDSILSLRKIVLPINRTPEIPPELSIAPINIGTKVRLIWPPFMGLQGKVVAIDKTYTVLESGIATFMLTIETPTKKLKVAFTNIEIIG